MMKQYAVSMVSWFHSDWIFKSNVKMTAVTLIFAKLYPEDTKINVRDCREKRKCYINSSDKI